MDKTREGSSSLLEATSAVVAADLEWMVLTRDQLPAEVSGFEMLRESEVDNGTMAEHGAGERTAHSLRELGRVTGYVRGFALHQGAPTLSAEPAEILLAATVVHLFDNQDAVGHWIDEVFVRDFRDRVGKETGSGHLLTGVEVLEVSGFDDQAAALLAVQEVADEVLGSTIVDFRVGRLLGVAYAVAKRDVVLKELAQEMGLQLERQMVRVTLGAA